MTVAQHPSRAMYESKASVLIRNLRKSPSECWQALGHPELTFSNREVAEDPELKVVGDRAVLPKGWKPAEVRRDESLRRSEAARKRNEEYRAEPLSLSARSLLDRVVRNSPYGLTIYDSDSAIYELTHKGYACSCDIKRYLGPNLWGYFKGLKPTFRGLREMSR